MPLLNLQYETIMRDYDRRQLENKRQLETRRQEIYQKIPRIEAIQQEIASLSTDYARRRIEGFPADTDTLNHEIEVLASERRKLLQTHGYDPSALEMTYHCPDCLDTGYINDEKCHCFKQAALQLLYDQSNLTELLKKENFEHFSLSYYSDRIRNKETGKTALDHARFALRKAVEFVDCFGTEFQNLLIYGDTGVGKTFLTNCIAHELIKQQYSVMYFSAFDLFDIMAQNTFSKESDVLSNDFIFNCDLLIIDDLGTELTNSFVSSSLFLLVNERIAKKKSTIISTNYDIAAFPEVYSTRTFSRIMQHYTLINLIGSDIRIQKTLGGTQNETN